MFLVCFCFGMRGIVKFYFFVRKSAFGAFAVKQRARIVPQVFYQMVQGSPVNTLPYFGNAKLDKLCICRGNREKFSAAMVARRRFVYVCRQHSSLSLIDSER